MTSSSRPTLLTKLRAGHRTAVMAASPIFSRLIRRAARRQKRRRADSMRGHRRRRHAPLPRHAQAEPLFHDTAPARVDTTGRGRFRYPPPRDSRWARMSSRVACCGRSAKSAATMPYFEAPKRTNFWASSASGSRDAAADAADYMRRCAIRRSSAGAR